MPNYGTYAICPYFETEDPLHIKCEGIVQLNKVNTEFVMRFPNKDKKKDWLKEYCETYQYGKCPYAAIIENSYDNAGKCRVIHTSPRPVEIVAPSKAVKVKKSRDIKGQLSFNFERKEYHEKGSVREMGI